MRDAAADAEPLAARSAVLRSAVLAPRDLSMVSERAARREGNPGGCSSSFNGAGSESPSSEPEPRVAMERELPEGGLLAWLVVIASFIVHVCVFGMHVRSPSIRILVRSGLAS
eukprot:tig00020961_g16704.t1